MKNSCDEYRSSLDRLNGVHNRRKFLQTAAALAAGATLPNMMLSSAFASHGESSTSDPILVVVQLAGGNDGLNTVVPYTSDLYYHSRPNISVPAKKVLALDKNVGLNPNLSALKTVFDSGHMAIVQGVGYPGPDRSHFRSTQIWETADPKATTATGWLGRYLDVATRDDRNPLKAVAVGSSTPMTLLAESTPVPSIETLESFRFLLGPHEASLLMDAFRAMYTPGVEQVPEHLTVVQSVGRNADESVSSLGHLPAGKPSTIHYPNNSFARDLQLVARLIASGVGTRIFHVTLGGFDDHAAEVYAHANLMKVLAESLSAFYADMRSRGRSQNLLILTFSEFGRRVRENAGRGTDHGTAAPLFVIGDRVKGGVHGKNPISQPLDANGDLRYDIDFRSVYATIIDRWFGADSKAVLGGAFERLPFL